MVLLRHHRLRLSAATALALLFFAFAFSVTAFSPIRQLGTLQEREETRKGSWLQAWEGVGTRRRLRLTGPGSSPPTCRSKCGRCSPCKPVHVPIQPGWSTTLEYYPEAWRCKCGNKFFMP
ncbi:hypothetical protein NE237_011507 [Protea cynaroides]|uniref:Epidermal patterning factor-like protein n=1 Tax=Protea cynaroides TaxID=273540 RepID=A0A9Q0JVX1_9MAGN|nr:hypothetical protein NE237_011507 [Protea cynaroides]